MALDDSLIDELETLAALRLEPQERAVLRAHLERVLGYVAELHVVDTTGVEPTHHLEAESARLRDDENVPGLSQDDALEQAPARRQGHFEVPAVMSGPDAAGTA